MSNCKDFTKLNVQREDRVSASNKLHAVVNNLTKVDKSEVFFDESCSEIFSETILVPVKVVCLESKGERRVFVNASTADPSTMNMIVSKELIECLQKLKKTVDVLDAELGCENLSAEAAKIL